jgi:hypothetical protein
MGFDYRAFSSISSAARCSTPAALRLSFAYVLSGGLLEFSSDHLGGVTVVFFGGTADRLKVSSGGAQCRPAPTADAGSAQTSAPGCQARLTRRRPTSLPKRPREGCGSISTAVAGSCSRKPSIPGG